MLRYDLLEAFPDEQSCIAQITSTSCNLGWRNPRTGQLQVRGRGRLGWCGIAGTGQGCCWNGPAQVHRQTGAPEAVVAGWIKRCRAFLPTYSQQVWMAARRAAMWIRSQTPENGGA